MEDDCSGSAERAHYILFSTLKNMKIKTLLATLAGLSLLASAQATFLLIDFETESGYEAGQDLVGQPNSGTTWERTFQDFGTNNISVVEGIGVGGTMGIAGVGGGTGNFVFYGFNATNTDLGFTFDSSSSVLQYSFAWRPTQALDGAVGTDIFRFTIGSDETSGGNAAMNLTIRASGRLIALDGGTNRAVDGLFTLNEYAMISGTIDYDTNTFTVFVNNNQQFTAVNEGNLAFNNLASDNAFIRIANLQGTTADHRSWNMDNISIIPEPRVYAAIFGLLAIGFVLVSRRRRA